MKSIISLDDLEIIATISRRYATAAEVAAVAAEIEGWHADEDEPYVVTADEVAAVLRVRGVMQIGDGKTRPAVAFATSSGRT